jgi:hypothetical protein
VLKAIHADVTVSANGSEVVRFNDGSKEVSLIVNVTLPPTGVAPTLQYTMQEVDPGNDATPFGDSASTAVILAAGVYRLTVPVTFGASMKVSWAVGGGGPSFPGVYASFTTKIGAVDEADASDSTVDITDVPVSVAPVTLLAANPSRIEALIFNDSNKSLTLKLGTNPTASSRTTVLPPGSDFTPSSRYTGIITGFWASGATGSAAVTEIRSTP